MLKPGLPLNLFCLLLASWNVSFADESLPDAVLATYKIQNQTSTGTCFLISRPAELGNGQIETILITAAHVLEKMSGEQCRLVARIKQGDGSFDRHEITVKIRSEEKNLWVRHGRADIAGLKLDNPNTKPLGALGIDQLVAESELRANGIDVADEVWIPGFPAQLESNESGFPVLRRGSVASFPLTPVKVYETFIVDSNTFGGDSGAPVLVRNRKQNDSSEHVLVVGLIVGKHRETAKSVTPFDERIVHRPMGLAIAVHSEFIRQTVELIKPAIDKANR